MEIDPFAENGRSVEVRSLWHKNRFVKMCNVFGAMCFTYYVLSDCPAMLVFCRLG
jgi:hypothetical protein